MTSADPLLPPTLDPAAAHPELGHLREAVNAQDWPAIARFFDGLHGANDRLYATRVVGELAGCEHLLERTVAADSSPLARVLLASRHVELGWEARSGARAKYVKEEQWAVFREHLTAAERLLIDVTALEPDNAAAWGLRLHVATGLSLGLNEARRRYNRLTKHHPHVFLAQTRMVQQLCPKWGGTWEEMHAFARECLLSAPEGSPNGSTVAEGHLERWLDLSEGADVKYLQQSSVQQELVEAATRSVLHPAFRKEYGWVQAHGYFAMAFSLAGAYAKAAPHFRAMGNLATEMPWAYAGEAEAVFMKHRAKALAKG